MRLKIASFWQAIKQRLRKPKPAPKQFMQVPPEMADDATFVALVQQLNEQFNDLPIHIQAFIPPQET